MAKGRVALVKGEDRYGDIIEALRLIEDDIHPQGRILVKPNFTSTTKPLAATHVDAVRAVLDFLQEHTSSSITIGEGAGLTNTFEGYKNFGYLDLVNEYGVQLVDLNRDEWIEVKLYDRHLHPLRLRVARTVVDSHYRISVCPLKTHDFVVVTLSLKNMLVGSLIRDDRVEDRTINNALQRIGRLIPDRIKQSLIVQGMKSGIIGSVSGSDKAAIHQGYGPMNLSLYELAKLIPPHLSVIDGFVGMEGAGPVYGDPVEMGVAIASTDFLAADTVAARIMGFDIDQVGYLHYCKLGGLGVGDLDRIEILVGNLEECSHSFRPHPDFQKQLQWHLPEVEQFL